VVARRAERLAALAGEIRASGGAAPIVIPCDLNNPMPATNRRRPWPPKEWRSSSSSNNAGFGLFGTRIELDRTEQLGIIAVTFAR